MYLVNTASFQDATADSISANPANGVLVHGLAQKVFNLQNRVRVSDTLFVMKHFNCEFEKCERTPWAEKAAWKAKLLEFLKPLAPEEQWELMEELKKELLDDYYGSLKDIDC